MFVLEYNQGKGDSMLFILKDMLRSKTMVLAFIFIIAVSYLGGLNNQSIEKKTFSDVNVQVAVN